MAIDTAAKIALVQKLMEKAWTDSNFCSLINATTDGESVHGSIWFDDVFAALHIQDLAKRTENMEEIASMKLYTLHCYIHHVLSMSGLSRMQRWVTRH